MRGDFDCEYQQEAETYLADLEFEADDTEHELSIKKKILEEYNLKLNKRIMMKTFFIDRCLNRESVEREAKRVSREDKLIRNAMRSVEGYFTLEEYETVRMNFYRKLEVHRRIEKLNALKEQGLRTFADIESCLGKRVLGSKHDSPSDFVGVPNSRKHNDLTEYERGFVEQLRLKPEAFKDWKLQLAKAAVKEGYVEQHRDEKGQVQFRRSADHHITEFFDFILGWKSEQ